MTEWERPLVPVASPLLRFGTRRPDPEGHRGLTRRPAREAAPRPVSSSPVRPAARRFPAALPFTVQGGLLVPLPCRADFWGLGRLAAAQSWNLVAQVGRLKGSMAALVARVGAQPSEGLRALFEFDAHRCSHPAAHVRWALQTGASCCERDDSGTAREAARSPVRAWRVSLGGKSHRARGHGEAEERLPEAEAATAERRPVRLAHTLRLLPDLPPLARPCLVLKLASPSRDSAASLRAAGVLPASEVPGLCLGCRRDAGEPSSPGASPFCEATGSGHLCPAPRRYGPGV